jgi:hypothetical protein
MLQKEELFVEDIKITVIGGQLEQEEIDAYIAHAKEKYPDRKVNGLEIELDGDYVNIKYDLEPIPFDRIRRITGYLVGTLDRFNAAKRAEVEDRVKHTIS